MCIRDSLGVSREWLMYEREPHEFRYPYAFDVPLDSWVELCVANAFYDQAGFCLLSDVHDNTSYGPWKRGLVKVGKEENFHLLHGRRWMKIDVKELLEFGAGRPVESRCAYLVRRREYLWKRGCRRRGLDEP